MILQLRNEMIYGAVKAYPLKDKPRTVRPKAKMPSNSANDSREESL